MVAGRKLDTKGKIAVRRLDTRVMVAGRRLDNTSLFRLCHSKAICSVLASFPGRPWNEANAEQLRKEPPRYTHHTHTQIVTPEELEALYRRGLRQAENAAKNSFHCRSANCEGF